MASTVNLSIDQGTTFRRLIQVRDDSQAAVDLTGYLFKAEARPSYGADVAFAFTFTIRNQSSDKGKVDMVLQPVATSVLVIKANTPYIYDIEMIAANGVVTRLFQGTITLSPASTR